MTRTLWVAGLVVLGLAGSAVAKDEPSKIDALEQRLEQQRKDLQALQDELKSLREGGRDSVTPGAAPAPDEAAPDPLAPKGREGSASDPPPAASGGGDEDAGQVAVMGDQPIKLGLFYIESADGKHRLDINGRLMVDFRHQLERDHDDVDDTFQVRRARIDFSGRIYRQVTFKLGLEFGRTSDADLRDAWVNLAFTDWFQVRAGQMLVPFSTERLTTSNVMKFPERPIIVGNIAELREVGVMLHGQAFQRVLAYYVGVYNGNGQNVANDNDDDKDLALRLEVFPIKALMFAASYRYTPTNRQDSQGPSDYRTVGNQLTEFLDYDTGANLHRSHRERGTIDARVRVGPVEVKGEVLFDYWSEMVSGLGLRDDLMNWGWFIDTSVVLTGEESQDTIDPASPFWGEEGFGTGAFEASVRYEEFHADEQTIKEGFAVGTDTVQSTSVALTWIPVRRVRAILSYTYSHFEDVVVDSEGNRRGDDHAIIARLGFWF